MPAHAITELMHGQLLACQASAAASIKTGLQIQEANGLHLAVTGALWDVKEVL